MSLVLDPPNPAICMDAFLISAITVGIAEIGDKSLLLTILLVVRYQRPWSILGGMTGGIFLNHALAALLGAWLAVLIGGAWLQWIVGATFIAMSGWALIPEQAEDPHSSSRHGIFMTAVIGFFILEMADKTQLATITLAAAFESFLPVVLGSTIGLLLANAPGLWLGHCFAARLPLKAMRLASAVLFLVLGSWILLEASGMAPGLKLFDGDFTGAFSDTADGHFPAPASSEGT